MNRKVMAIGLASLIAGCTSTKKSSESSNVVFDTAHQRTPTDAEVIRHVYGHELRQANEKDIQYNLEEIALYGERMYAENNIGQTDNQLDFVLVRPKESERHINANGLVEIVSDFVYIPTQEINDHNQNVTRINLSTEGPYAIRANLTQFDLPRNKPIGVIKESNEDAKFNIRTVIIKDKEYYVLAVESAKTADPEALPFYIMPHEGTTQIINEETGKMSLKNVNGFFRPRKTKITDYQEAMLIREGLAEPTHNPGQAESTD
ncbi:MAG: hypothetical protein AABW79_02560 [Nanoarchaeota archaeon]